VIEPTMSSAAPHPARLPRRAAIAAAVALAVALPCGAGAKGTYRESPHGNPKTGVVRVPSLKRGECTHCHGASRDASERGPGKKRGHAGLFAQNDNSLCASCHRSAAGTYLGDAQYEGSAHGRSPVVVWPGPTPPARPSTDAGKCVNCHDPHGQRDAGGLIPDLLRARGAALCLGCHRGNPGPDVAAAFLSTYRHPLVDDAPAADPGGAPVPTCGACHNAHAAAHDDASPIAREASGAVLGVTRVRVSNGSAGQPPVLALVPSRDVAPVRELEVCFKCHSSAAPAPSRGADVAAALNPANASFHPVEEAIRGAGVDRRAFTNAWRGRRTVTCSDCHSPDDGVSRGPHGSNQPHLLKKRHLPPASTDLPLPTDLCFDCHAFETYADPAGGAGGAYSRFPGHLSHAAKGTPCSACHASHGSPTLPALLVLRSPGLMAYTQDAAGASCTSSCHRTVSAAATYRSPSPR
jgi:predicted CXXCH cytochrome family protein